MRKILFLKNGIKILFLRANPLYVSMRNNSDTLVCFTQTLTIPKFVSTYFWISRSKRHFIAHPLKFKIKIYMYWLTAAMKKSRCITETTPKLVYLNTLSIIHMILGSTFGLALKVVISIGTSPVLWWFDMTNVLSLISLLISSPCSITMKHLHVRIIC